MSGSDTLLKKKKSQIHRCSVPFSIHEVVEQAKLISIRKKKNPSSVFSKAWENRVSRDEKEQGEY